MNRRLLLPLLTGALILSARAEIKIYSTVDRDVAEAAIAVLNQRPEQEKYVLAATDAEFRAAIRRFFRPLNFSGIAPDAPLLRTKVAMVLNREGKVVDTVGFDANSAEFAAAVAEAMPNMVAFVANKAKKTERVLVVWTFNSHSSEPEEVTTVPVVQQPPRKKKN